MKELLLFFTCISVSFYPQTTADSTTPEPIIPQCSDPVQCTMENVGHMVSVPSNCNQFIYCNEFGKDEPSQCRSNTYFNEQTQSCVTTSDHCAVCLPTKISKVEPIISPVAPTIPPCPEMPTCDGLTEGTTLPVPGKCSEYIYCGPNGVEEYSTCRPGYAFDVDYMYCRNASEANCPECLLPTTTPIITTTLGECEPTPLCYLEEYDTKKPYPPDCRYYVYCSGLENGTDGRLRVCPSGYLFDITILECMLANETSCLRCSVPPTTTEEPTTTYYCPALDKCVPSVNDFKAFPIPQNCSYYYFCDPAIPIGYQMRRCATGNLFDQVLLRCVNETIAYCPECVLTTEIDITSLSPYPPCAAQETCPLMGSGSLIPYPPDCTKYFYCNGGIGDMMTCPVEQHFSPVERTCMAISDANCPLCSP